MAVAQAEVYVSVVDCTIYGNTLILGIFGIFQRTSTYKNYHEIFLIKKNGLVYCYKINISSNLNHADQVIDSTCRQSKQVINL